MATAKAPYRSPDTLFTDDTLEVILGLGEGPNKGLENGGKSAYFGDTPLLNSTGRPNVGNFDLKVYKGSNPGEIIRPNLGGSGSATTVGVPLTEGFQEVIRRGTQTNIDYIDVRFNLNVLRYIDNKGNDAPTWLNILVQVKRQSQTWEQATTVGLDGGNSDNSIQTNIRTASDVGEVANSAYTEVYARPTAPTGVGLGALWFKTDATNGAPKIWNGTAWVNPPSLAGVTQGAFYKWTFVDYQDTVRTAYWSSTGAVPSVTLNPLDLLISPTGVTSGVSTPQSFVWNGSAFVNSLSWATPPTVTPGVQVLFAHISSSTGKTFRLRVPRVNEFYDIRVIRASPTSDQYYNAEFSWDSFQELTITPQQYNDLSLAHLTIRASEQFTSLPEFSFVMEGRIIRVPTNFNEVTKVYTGVWDGLFKNAYTNDVAWIAYDLVMNTRYGMNAYFPCTLDKWDTYKFSQHCIQNGFTFNEYITEPRNLKEMVDYVVGVAGGRFVDRMDGFSTILFDADDTPAVAQFSAENIVDGLVTYSFTDITERKNDFTVSFVNPNLNWREDRIRVFDQTSITKYGRNPEEFIAVGCIDETEAVKRGRYRLATSITEKTTINFKTNRTGLYLEPYNVITFADPEMGDGLSGRIKAVLSTTQVSLRDSIYLEAGFVYTISFQVPVNGAYTLVTKTLAAASGNVSTLTFTTPLTGVTLPPQAQFTISQATKVGVPKAYRIESISEIEGDPDNVSITAMEVNRLKWAYVRGEVTLRDLTGISTGNVTGYVAPVSNLRVVPVVNPSGSQNLNLSWDKSATTAIKGYRVYEQVDAGTMQIVADNLTENKMTMYNVAESTYIYKVVAIGMGGQESPPNSVIHTVAGGPASVSVVRPISNLELVDEAVVNQFTSISPKVRWAASPSAYIKDYRVDILTSDGLTVIRTEYTTATEYEYLYDSNVRDSSNNPRRSFIFRVYARSTNNDLSSSVQLSVTNLVPATPSVTIDPAIGLITLRTGTPADRDYKGTIFWVSTTNGFNTGTTTPIYDGPNNEVTFKATADTTYYIRVATYDTFGKTGLNVSAQQSTQPIKVTGVDIVAQAIATSHLQDGLITSTQIAASVPIIRNYATVPATNVGATITVGTNPSHLYTWNGTAYVRTVAANMLDGLIADTQIAGLRANQLITQVIASQIASVSASVVTGALTNATLAATAVTGQITNAQIAAGLDAAKLAGTIDAARFAAQSIPAVALALAARSPDVVTTLPTTGNFEGRTVYYQERLYTYTSGAWLNTSSASTITGTITAGQISSVNAGAISGEIANANIAAGLDAAKLTVGILPIARIAGGALDITKFASTIRPVELFTGSLPTTGNTEGRQGTLNGRLYTYTSGAWKDVASTANLTGTIAAAQITAGAINTIHLATDSVTTAAIAAGAVNAEQIAARAIRVEHLVVGTNFANMVPQGDFELPDLSYFGFSGSGSQAIATDTTANSGTKYLVITKAAAGNSVYSQLNGYISVEPGKQYDIRGSFRGPVAATAGVYLRVFWLRSDLTFTTVAGTISPPGTNRAATYTDAVSNAPITTSWVERGGLCDAPADAAFARLAFYHHSTSTATVLHVDSVSMKPATDGVSIQDGAIIAAKIAADSINANHLQALSVTTSKLLIQSTNRIYNSGFDANILGVAAGGTAGTSVAWHGAGTFSVGNTKSVLLANSGSPASGQTMTAAFNKIGLNGASDFKYPVVAGQRIEFSAYLNVYRATNARVQLNFYTAADAYVSSAVGNVITGAVQNGDLADSRRSFFVGVVPATATYCIPYVVGLCSGESAPNVYISKVMLANAAATQTEPSPYVSGEMTSIDGGTLVAGTIVTGHLAALAVTADKIATNAITSDKIAAGQIVAGHILAGAVTATAIATNAINTVHINAGAVTADQIGAQAVLASKLAVSTTNLLYNSNLAQGSRGWSISSGGGMTGILFGTSTEWCPTGYTSYFTRSTATPTTGMYIDTYCMPRTTSGAMVHISVSPNTRYELSAYTSTHRATSRGYIQWVDSAGASISYSEMWNEAVGSGFTGTQFGPMTSYNRKFGFATSPSNAARAYIFFRLEGNGNANPYLFISCPLLSPVSAAQTEPSPYTVGGTTLIDGGNIYADSITTLQLAAGSVQTAQLDAGSVTAAKVAALAIAAGNIQADAIQSQHILAGAIVAGKLAAASVATDNLIANSITAGKLALADTSNMILNPGFENPVTGVFSSEGWVFGAGTVSSPGSAADAGGRNRIQCGNVTTVYVASYTSYGVRAGDTLYASAMGFNARNTGNMYLFLRYLNASGVQIGSTITVASSATRNAWVTLSGQSGVLPAGTSQVVIFLAADAASTGLIYFGGRSVLKQAMSTLLIVDGAIVAAHLSTDSVTTNALAANSVTTAQIAANAVKAAQIDVGAVSADKLGVALHDNYLYNSDFLAPITGWPAGAAGASAVGTVASLIDTTVLSGSYTPPGMRTLQITKATQINTGDYFDFYMTKPAATGFTPNFPVTAGEWYEASAYMSAHRCTGSLFIRWYNAAGTNLSNSVASQTNAGTGPALNVLTDAVRVKQRVQAPAGAAYATIMIRLSGTSTAGSQYLFVTGVVFGRSVPTAAAAYIPWSPGPTIIDGQGIRTGSIFAAQIAAGTITANEIASLTITGDKIVAGTITVDKLNVATLSAISANLGTITAGSISFPAGSSSFIEMWDST